MSRFAPLDIDALRQDTPGTAFGVYMNNAAVSLSPKPVLAVMHAFLDRESQIGGYGAAAEADETLEGGYAAAARLLGCEAAEIAFTDGNSRGWQAAIGALSFKAGDRILVGESEWGGGYSALLHIAERTGAVIEAVPSDETGAISLSALADMMDDRVRLIALTWAPAGGGLLNPAAGVGVIARAAGVTYVLDAAQAVGQLPVDVSAIGCDVLTAPGRKWLRGPRGSGLLYVRRSFWETHEPAVLDQYSGPLRLGRPAIRQDARRFETSESSAAVRIGLCKALDYALGLGIEPIRERIVDLSQKLRAELADVAGVEVRDTGVERTGLVTFTVARRSAAEVKAALSAQGITTVVSAAPYTPLDFARRGLTEVVRASPHVFNTDADVSRLVAVVAG